MSIRPLQIDSLISLFSLLAINHQYYLFKDCSENFKCLLIQQGLLQDQSLTQNNQTFKMFEKGSIEYYIMLDDDKEFTNLTKVAGFEPNKLIQMPYFMLDGVKSISTNRMTYSNLMALFGSVKCFKSVISDEKYDMKGIENFAVAGGNLEIIDILKQKGYSFDNCFETAVEFHRHEICDFLIENYKCEKISEFDCRCLYKNEKAFYFFTKNG